MTSFGRKNKKCSRIEEMIESEKNKLIPKLYQGSTHLFGYPIIKVTFGIDALEHLAEAIKDKLCKKYSPKRIIK